jgi:hypothetical protein
MTDSPRFCKVCGGLIPDSAHKNRKICTSEECQKEQKRRRNAKFKKKHKAVKVRRLRNTDAKEMLDRLRENARDPEARAWCRQKHITYLFLSRGGQKSVEIRFKKT